MRARHASAGLLALLGSAALLVVAGPAAQAHNQLRSTAPAAGAVVDVAPSEVVLTFDQPVLALGTRVVVLAPDGRAVAAGDPALVDDDVRQPLAGELPAGEYRVEWRATSADGHPVSGELTFTAAGAGATAAAPTTDASEKPSEQPVEPSSEPVSGSVSGPSPVLVALAVTAAAVAVGVAVGALVVRRRHPRG